MARKRKAANQDHCAHLGRRLRSLMLRLYIHSNPYHDQPGWEELSDFSRAAWTRIAEAMLTEGWIPPLTWRED